MTFTKWSPTQLDIRGAAFWTYLRESIRSFLLNEQTCQFDLALIEDEPLRESAPEEAWANRMAYLLARVCNTCWRRDVETYQRQTDLDGLKEVIGGWHDCVPETYRPWYNYQVDSQPFPTLRYLSTCHCTFPGLYYPCRYCGLTQHCRYCMAAILRRKSDPGCSLTPGQHELRYNTTQRLPLCMLVRFSSFLSHAVCKQVYELTNAVSRWRSLTLHALSVASACHARKWARV